MYFLKRSLWMIPTLIGIVTITFFLTRLRPDPVAQKGLNPDAMQENSAAAQHLEQLKEYYGYDKPLIVQYGKMWKNILTLNFSNSRIDHRPVLEKLIEALPYTLTLNIITVIIVYLISIPLGVYSALHDGSKTDSTITFLLYLLYSLPSFWIALLLLKYFAGGDFLNFFPLGGWQSDYADDLNFFQKIGDIAWHLFLPIVVSVYGSFAFLSRFIKSSLLEALRSEYIRTAKAKGLSQRRVIYVHALRNSLIPLITLMAGLLPGLFGGSVILEQIFSIPGMGKLAYDSIYANDDPVIIAIVLFSAILTMLGILLTDFVYTLVDPRISFSESESK